MTIHVIIPARYDSSRLPGKVLLDIAGQPMIQRVYEQAKKSKADSVIIATDDDRIVAAAKSFKAQVCLTASMHRSGTERISEAIEKLGLDENDIVVNVQGDEPLLPPELIDQVAAHLKNDKSLKMSTLCEPISELKEIFDPNIVKVVRDAKGYAIYFSRASIPWYRDGFNQIEKQLPADFSYYRHIGLYAYRAGFIKQYVNWFVSPLEQIESLEQLRVLWHGERIYVDIAQKPHGLGIDTPQDLERVRRMF